MAWPVGALIEVKVFYTANLQKCMNVFHYQATGVSTGFTIPELTASFGALNASPGNGTWTFEFAQVMAENVLVTGASVQLVYPQRWRAFEVATSIAGVRPGFTTAQNVQASLTKLGDMANRHNQGGMRIGGISPNDYATGLITGAYKGALEDLVDELILDRSDSLTAADYLPVIANKEVIPGSNPKRYRFSGSTGITSWIIENELRTQRTRTVGRGE